MPAVLSFSLSYPTHLQVSLEALEEGVCSRTCLVVTTCLVDVSLTLAKRDTCHKICGTISFVANHYSLQVHVFSKCRVMAMWELMSSAFQCSVHEASLFFVVYSPSIFPSIVYGNRRRRQKAETIGIPLE